MSPVVRLGLLALAAVGGAMIWLQREQPLDGVTVLICAVGLSLVVMSLWAFVLPRRSGTG